MKHIVVFGAGKSSTFLLRYLSTHADAFSWNITVADANLAAVQKRIAGLPHTNAMTIDVNDADARQQLVRNAELVISLLPPSLHAVVAADCLQLGKHLITASYVDAVIQSMASAVREKGLLFLCEMGLDPGIDHMSAMELINRLRDQGAEIISFFSHCGGLVAPESDTNPWHYKISWNPRNVVLAGKAGAIYRLNGETIQEGYQELFRPGRLVDVPGYGQLAWYPNRDSLSYLSLYGLEKASGFMRTTLRHPDFISAWQRLVQIGLTDEQPLPYSSPLSLGAFLHQHVAIDDGLFRRQMEWLGYNNSELIIEPKGRSKADILQQVLEKRLRLDEGDKDLVVMMHEIVYRLSGKTALLRSSLVVEGEDEVKTAMAKTVGLPLAVAAKLILQGNVEARGVQRPLMPEIYEPALTELATYGIRFVEYLSPYDQPVP